MTKIARRSRVVTLPQGDDAAALKALREEIVAAHAAEGASGSRLGSKSAVVAKAREFDKRKAKAEAAAAKVTVYEIAYSDYGPLQELHPPREDDAIDKRVGYNRKTFPQALLKVSLVEPDTAKDLDDLIAKGDAAFAELGGLSQMHYTKLMNEAWDVHTGDDSIPFYSAESLVKQLRDPDSAEQPDSE